MKVALIVALCIAFVAATPFKVKKERAPIPPGSCGKNSLKEQPGFYIVGGEDAQQYEFPYQVSLQRVSIFGASHTCGGSVINNQWIVSAAHCFSEDRPSKWQVVTGMHNLYSTDEGQVSRSVSEIIVHEDYQSWRSNKNDIALMKLSEPIVFDNSVQPICLAPADYSTLTGQDVVATGWGTTSEGGSLARVLQKVSVPVISNTACAAAYPREDIYDSQICAGLDEGGKDSCQGDSGGPLAHLNSDGSYVLVGITSWGYGCAQAGYPGVYTRAAEFYDWIMKNAV